ncbi:MAG: PQQ-dependent sugar dehydrogenase, partial [Albidovulum sp.]|uniref:PQQ-dependent sugar dehydrogenase n=1 Tax=Albidovulum sp. TaxID=1872424 RepID=UPI003CB45C56
ETAGMKQRLFLALGVFVLLGFTFLAGIAAEYVVKPTDFARRAVHKLRPKEPDAPVVSSVESTFLMFRAETAKLPITRYARGGGLTVLDGSVVAMTVDGKLYIASDANTIRPLSIETPDYNFGAYKAFSEEPANSDYSYAFWGYRYADVLAYRFGDQTRLAISFTRFDPKAVCYRTVVSTLDIPETAEALAQMHADPGEWTTLLETQPCLPLKKNHDAIEAHMGGGRFAYDGNGVLYMTSGDYHFDGIYYEGAPVAQDPAFDYGKVIAIDLTTGSYRQITRGHRNMQGIAIDKLCRVWTVEHGMRGGDELNMEIEGRDYGWPRESLGTLYNKLPIPNTVSYGHHDQFEQPRLAFVPSIATSSLSLIDGFHEAWDGDLLMGTLKDQSLYRIHLSGDRVLFAERIPIGERVRYAQQLDHDRIVVLTDDNELVFLTTIENAAAVEFLTAYLAQPELDRDTSERLAANMENCLQCHSLDPDSNTSAPTLANVFDGRMGSTEFAGYSPGFRGRRESWSRESLAAFITSPRVVVPDTVMPDPGIDDPDEVEALIDFLAAMSSPQVFAGDGN